jgi:hypothetical protein
MASKHTEDLKQEAVWIALTSGLSRRRVAADLGVGLSRWASGCRHIGQPIWYQHRSQIWCVRMNACA